MPVCPFKNSSPRSYLLSGVVAAIAAIIYTSRLGQAKADAGTGYELIAITAVVLGGTSIFGGVRLRPRNTPRRCGNCGSQ
jgi:rhamnose transport system permease protein